ncbi:hypothetical protein [Streptomyces platensis]|nr:hypothetical protein [Streptomyces platensis]
MGSAATGRAGTGPGEEVSGSLHLRGEGFHPGEHTDVLVALPA